MPTYSEDDLIVLNLAQRVAKELNLRITLEQEAELLKSVRLYSSEAYKTACAIAAFYAHHAHIPFNVVADALRKVAKRKTWISVQESKELVVDVTKVAAKLESSLQTRKSNPKRKSSQFLMSLQKQNKSNKSLPPFEHVHLSAKKSRNNLDTSWTVLPNVSAKEYNFLSDVFAPDNTALAMLDHCMPVVMAIVSPSEKSFLNHLGNETSTTALYEFVSNMSCTIPILLITGHRDFQDNIMPAGKKKKKNFLTSWTQYYASFLTVAVSSTPSDVSDRFAVNYKSKEATFRRLLSVAKTALFKRDDFMLQACAVRAVYLHLSGDISEQTEKYILQIVRVCIEMYRHSASIQEEKKEVEVVERGLDVREKSSVLVKK